MTVEIRTIPEESCRLYDKYDRLLGVIQGELSLLDIRCQIKKKQLEGYYITWRDIRIDLNRDGRLSDYPRGFFDEWDRMLECLLEGRWQEIDCIDVTP